MIRASASRQIAALVADLSSDRAVARDAAIARLTIFGARASEPLIALVGSGAAAPARAAALKTLEAIGDPQARTAIVRAIDDLDPAVASAAASAARGFLLGPHGAEVLDRLARAALDASRDRRVRQAAVAAVSVLAPSTVAPLMQALRRDPTLEIPEPVQPAAGRGASRRPDPAKILACAAEGELPDDPGMLRHAIATSGSSAPLTALLRIIEAVRAREEREGRAAPEVRDAWRTVRASAHLMLANRGSRIAVYDLRESVAAPDARQPVEFLAALAVVGDASCLEAIAAAHARARDRWWKDHLADTFRTIIAREGLTRRNAVIKRIEKRWPQVLTTQLPRQ